VRSAHGLVIGRVSPAQGNRDREFLLHGIPLPALTAGAVLLTAVLAHTLAARQLRASGPTRCSCGHKPQAHRPKDDRCGAAIKHRKWGVISRSMCATVRDCTSSRRFQRSLTRTSLTRLMFLGSRGSLV